MKNFIFLTPVILAIFTASTEASFIEASWWETFKNNWNGALYALYNSYQDYIINLKISEVFIDKPLPADWVPHPNPKWRTLETELKW